MKINNFRYLLKEGIRGIFLHGFMSFAAICVTVACLLIVGTFSSLLYNVNVMVEELNKTNEVIAYIDEKLPLEDAKSVETKIRALDEYVASAKFKTNNEAWDDFIANYGEDSAFENYDSDVLWHRVVVTLKDNDRLEEAVEQISKVSGVVQIKAEYELAKGFSMLQNVLQIATVVIIAVLLLVSLLIISNTVKIAMHERRDEIAIMKMVGATNGFIRLPFVVEGFTLGMIGAGAAFGIMWLMYSTMLQQLDTVDILKKMFTFVPFEQLLVPMIVTFFGAGLFVGVVGSWTSIRKFLNV